MAEGKTIGRFAMRIKRSIAVILGLLVLAPVMALAAPQCFQPFSGVYIRFEQSVTDSTVARNGRIFGALSSCAGLSSWPVVGNSYHSKKDGIVLAFRAFTVDANSCGPTDWIGTLSGKPFSGPFQLFNQRTNFGNTGTWTEVKCPAPPKGDLKLPAEVDPLGNFAK
jgi:hypothetical protein